MREKQEGEAVGRSMMEKQEGESEKKERNSERKAVW